jgi:PAS domain S-box-containing protein
MKDPKDLPPDFADLRRRAEEQLQAEAVPPDKLSPSQAARLIHELRVHQIELEMQNDELRRSQALLEESRSKYADLYDFAPVGYLTLDALGAIVEANLTAATLLDVERSRLLGRFFPHFLVDADRRVFRQLLGNSLNQQERRGEFHLKNGNGDVRVMLLDILFLTDAAGQERRRVSLTDITELKRTQEELRLHKEDLEELVAHRTTELIEANEQLRQANERLEAMFQAAPLAIAEFDAAGKVTNINPAGERLYGWTLEEIQDRPPLSIPKDSPEESLVLLQRLLGGESVTGIEIKQQRQDGSLFDASVFGAPLRDARGKVRGFIGLAEDITERKKLAEDVRTQAQVLANMAEGVAVIDRRGQIMYTNPAFDAMFGYKPGELVGRHSNILNHTPPEENAGRMKEILTSIKTSGIWSGEFRNCRKSGSPFYSSARISALMVGGKKLYISVQEDVTERKKTREMLARQAELLDLAHDAILVRDPKGRITYWNQGAAHHYGWTREEALGQMSHKLLQTVFPQPLLEIERQLLEQGFWEGELIHTASQGRKLVTNSRWTAKRDEAGRVVAILEMNLDVTAQKEIEKEVHRLASFPLLNPNPVIEADEYGKVTYANPAARRLAEEFRFSGGTQAFLPPDLKEKFAALEKGGSRQYTYDLDLKDRVYTAVLSFPHDLPIARIYALDITGRQRAEQARRESEARYRSLVDLSPDAIMVHARGRYVFANPAGLKLFGAAVSGDLIGRRVLEMVHPDSQKTVRRRLRAGERLDIREVKILRLDGRAVEVEVAATPITYGGQPAVQVVLRDITERKRAEAAVAAAHRLLQSIIDNTTSIVYAFDLEGRFVLANSAVAELLNSTPEQMIGKRRHEFMPKEEADWHEGNDRQAIEAGRALDFEEYSHLRGRSITWLTTKFPLRDANGSIYAVGGISADITERKQAEAALRESEDRFRKIFENAAMGIAITDWQGRVQQVNPAHCAMLGYTGEELRGVHFASFIHPEDRDVNIKEIQRLQAGELPFFEVENRYIHKDGHPVWVHKFVSVLTDARGEPAHMVALATDITARRQAEEALRMAKEEWERTFDAVPDFISILDKDHRIVRVNKAMAEILANLPEEALRYPCYKAVHGLDEIPDFCPHAKVMATGQAASAVVEEFGLTLDVTVSPIFAPDGQLQGGVHIARDITEKKRAEKALAESEERYRSLFENSHASMLLIDSETSAIVDANPAASAYYGYSREEFLNHRITDINTLAPEQVKEELQQARNEARRHFEFKHRLADGRVRDVEVFSGPIRVKGRELLYSIVHDITARKEAEEAVRESEARFRSLFEGMTEGVALHEIISDDQGVARDYRILATNPAYTVHTGLAAEQVQGRLASEVYGLGEPPFLETYARVALIGQPETFEIYYPPLKRYFAISATSPKPGHFVTVFEDITDRKRLEDDLRQSEEQARARLEEIESIYSSAPVGLCVLDSRFRYVRINARMAEINGIPAEEHIGRTISEVVPALADQAEDILKNILKTGQPILNVEFSGTTAAEPGILRTWVEQWLPLKDSHGQVVSVSVAAEEITERKRMEDDLRQAKDELEVRVEERTAALRQAIEQLFREIQERQEVEDRLRDSETRFTAFMEHLPGLAVMRDMEGRYLFANRAWEETMDLPPGAWRGKTLAQLWPPERTAVLQKSDFEIISTGEPTEEVEVQTLADGPHHFLTSRFPIRDAEGLPYMVGAVAIDVTGRQRAEQQVAETGRLYRVLSQVNEAIMRGRDQQSLFDQVCRIVVEEGLFRMAWVGLSDSDTHTVRVAAKYGFDEGYLDNLAISLGDGAKGLGPTGTAVRENRYDVCNDFAVEPRMKPWREQALARGYGSSGAFPLRVGNAVLGAITLYAPRPEFFTDKEIALLTSLADNLSFALEFLDRDAKRRQAEAALATERQRLFDLLENLPAFIYLQAPDYSVRFANREFRERFGEPNGGVCYTLMRGGDRPCPDCPTFTVFHTGRPKEWEWTTPDSRIYQVYDYPFADVDGSPLVLEMGIDITQRKRAEEALTEQALLVQDLYNNAPCGYHSLDSEGYFVQINDTELAWLGYNRDEVIGKLKFADLITPESLKTFQETFPQLKTQGWVKDLEYELVRKDGTAFPVLLNATAVTDEAGNYLMSRSTIFDITERQRAEKALAAERQRLFNLMEQIPAYVVLLAPDYTVPYANREFIRRFGEGKEGQTCYEFLYGRKEPCPDCRTFKVLENNQPQEWEWLGPDGRTYAVYDHPFTDTDGSPLIVEMGIDITGRKRAEEVIREQGRQLEAFFAHSITPLVFLDPDFNFLRVNEAYARSCRREAPEFIGHNHFEFYPNAENEAIFAEVARSKIPYQVQAKPFEFPDHPEWGVTYWDWSLVPILNQAGEVDFLVFSLRDVTRRVMSEQARNRLIEILEATPDFVGIADFYGHLQYLNQAGRAMVGVGEDEDVSRLKVLDLHPQEIGRQILEQGVRHAMEEGAWQAELALLHRDGHEIPVSQVILAHKDAGGRVQFFSTVARDISDIKEARESILRQTAIVNGINRIFRETLTCETEVELGRTCLAVAEELTASRFGFIDDLNPQGTFDALAFSDPGWDQCSITSAKGTAHLKNIRPVGLLAKSVREGKAIIASEPASHPEAAGTPKGHPPLTAYLGVPLTYGDRTIGLIGLGNKDGGFTPADQDAVESLAPAIVEALMHHRAEEALKGSESKLRYLADQLLTAQENERKRLAAELHDELGHALLALKLQLSSIEKKLPPEQDDAKQAIRGQLNYIHEVIQDVRRLYHDLSPGDVEDLGLTKALGTLINDFASYFPGITWQVDLADMEGLFSLPVQTTIYRILQEALTNIGKHANPSTVNISSTKENHQVRFIVGDDGAGFDVAQLSSRSSGRGVGLVAMEERLNMVGGTFEIQSRVNEGTRLSFTIPAIPEGERP